MGSRPRNSAPILVGIDTGGTFTDLVALHWRRRSASTSFPPLRTIPLPR